MIGTSYPDRARASAANAPELSEIPPDVTAKLTVKPVRTMEEVLDVALVGSLAAMEKAAAKSKRRHRPGGSRPRDGPDQSSSSSGPQGVLGGSPVASSMKYRSRPPGWGLDLIR
jgi:hypothetical protein